MSMNYQEIMAILEEEQKKELECARKTAELMRRTLNPFRRIQLKKGFDTLIDHAAGIELAIGRIKREERA